MLIKYVFCALIVPALISSATLDDVSNGPNEINEMDYNRASTDYYGGNYSGNNDGNTWLDTARNALSGPAGQMVVHMAKEMISRSTGNSQVNDFVFRKIVLATISNSILFSFCTRFWVLIWLIWWYCYCWKLWFLLLVWLVRATGDNMHEPEVSIVSNENLTYNSEIVVLFNMLMCEYSCIIFKNSLMVRSSIYLFILPLPDWLGLFFIHKICCSLSAEFIHNDETPLFIGYLALEGSGQDDCLNRAACRAPQTANDYLKAAKAVVKGIEMFDNQKFNSSAYAYTFNKFESSIRKGIEGAPCNAIYQCSI